MSASGATGSLTLNETGVYQSFPKMNLASGGAVCAVTVATNGSNVAPVNVGTSPGGSTYVLQPVAVSGPDARNTAVIYGLTDLGSLWAWGTAGDVVTWGIQ